MLLKGEAGGALVCGFVARDAEVRYTGTGRKVANFSLKVEGGFGEIPAVWLRCVAWGDRADLAERIQKGDTVFAMGRLSSRSWTGNDGEHRTTEELTCDFLMIEGRGRQAALGQQAGAFMMDDALPFGPGPSVAARPEQLAREFMEERAAEQGTVFADEDLPF